MTRYAAFLRGVNVGGVNLKMAAVAKALEEAGFTNVRTILASGNVLLESRSGVDAVRKKAEAALRDAFGYDAWVLAIIVVRAISTPIRSSARSRVAIYGRSSAKFRRTRRARQGRATRRSNG
jgi:uncharacterized protein (DUF1697 family)